MTTTYRRCDMAFALSAARLAIIDEDYALVDRMLLDEARAALQGDDDPARRKLGDELLAYLNMTIVEVIERPVDADTSDPDFDSEFDATQAMRENAK